MSPIRLKSSTLALLAVLFQSGTADSYAQSVADIEKIVRQSKGVEAKRPLKVILRQGVLIVSTYSHPKASDQDCKINALFIMKDLVARYNTILRMSITFYAPAATRFRTIDVTQEQVALVEKGRPVQELLSEIGITRGDTTALVQKKYNNSKAYSGSPTYDSSSDNVAENGLIPELLKGLQKGKLPSTLPKSIGPYELERQLITSTIWGMKARGQDVTAAQQMINELNLLAARGDKASLDTKIPATLNYLHISSAQVADWRSHNGWAGSSK